MPVITRLYTPQDLGTLALFDAIIASLVPLATLRYTLATPLPRHDGLAMNLVTLSAALTLLLGILLTLVLAVFSESLFEFLSMQLLTPWWWIIPLSVVAVGSYETLSFWATRKREYGPIARTQITQQTAGSIVKIAFGFFGAGPFGLLLGNLIAQGGGVWTFASRFLFELRTNLRCVRPSRLKMVAIRYKGFPFYRLPSQLLLVFSKQSPVIFVATVFGVHVAGQLGLAMLTIALPMTLVGTSVATALFGEAAKIGIRDPWKLYFMAKTVQRWLFVIALLPATIIFFFGKQIFSLGFGYDWAEAGKFASLLSFILLFQFTSAPLIQMMNLLRSQINFLMINLLRGFLLALLMVIVYWLNLSATVFVALYSILTAVIYIFISTYVFYCLKKTAFEKI